MSSFNSYPSASGEKLPLDEVEIEQFFKGVVLPSVNHLWRKQTGKDRGVDFLRDSQPYDNVSGKRITKRPSGEALLELEAQCWEHELQEDDDEEKTIFRGIYLKIAEPMPEILDGILELKAQVSGNSVGALEDRAENEEWQPYETTSHAFTIMDGEVCHYVETTFNVRDWGGDEVWSETEMPAAKLGEPSSVENTLAQDTLDEVLDASLSRQNCRDIVRALQALGVPEVIMQPHVLARLDI